MSNSCIMNRSAAGLALVLGASMSSAESPQAPAAAVPASTSASAPAGKDIVLDRPASSASAPRLVPTPQTPNARQRTAVSATAAAAPLNDFGLDLWQATTGGGAAGRPNSVLSPLSVAAALGMLHAGLAEPDAREVAQLFGSMRAGRTLLKQALPAALAQAAAEGGPLKVASRLWVQAAAAKHLQPGFVQQLAQSYGASAQAMDFGQADAARGQINQWVAEQTNGLIQDLMPVGSVTANTRMAVTQALHFRSPWAQPFHVDQTVPMNFEVSPGNRKMVPTMRGEMKARAAEVDGFTVYELPFSKGGYVLTIALPPSGESVAKARSELEAGDLAAWQGQLKPVRCHVELPRLSLKSGSISMKQPLQELGVKKAFSPQADFKPALGAASAGLLIDEVVHAASFSLDEAGGEAAAATGASVGFKSIDLTAPKACKVDRPFIFALVHAPTQTPVLLGSVSDPTQP